MTDKIGEETLRELDKLMWENGLLDKADGRYAAKLIEKIVYGGLAAVGFAVPAAILKLINL